MAITSSQTKINLLLQKKALYLKRVEDARKRNRSDIEKIWLDEIKILDEKHAKLIAKEQDQWIKRSDTGVFTAIKERKLRQLNNQIEYIKRKIAIHKQRGENIAVQRQTILLLGLETKQSKLRPIASQTHSNQIQVNSSSVQATRTLTLNEQKSLDSFNADITHSEKMIKEYQKFKSPKAEVWIGKKFQLMAQRDQLLNNKNIEEAPSTPPVVASPALIHTTIPTVTTIVLPPVAPSLQSSQPDQFIIAEAQEVNKQVRVIDIEITHANKMIREYQKYKSPKVNQWLHRKNELLARRSRITGNIPQQQATLNTNAVNRKRLQIITLELLHADKMIKEYQKYNSPKAHDWIEKRNDLLAEKTMLGGGATPTVSNDHLPHSTQALSREAIKAQIIEFNRKAKETDTNMRAALRRGDHRQADRLHQQRDQYNQQSRQLTAQLNGTATNVIPTPVDLIPNTTPIHNSSQPNNALEKSIAFKYLQTRSYTSEDAYKEIIDTLLIEEKYQSLTPAKETLFDITKASQLPRKNTFINTPYIRDCFKIKTSDVLLDGYTINDTIFDTTFPKDFDIMIKGINRYVDPAPRLKPYKNLAHRDAIQLIPSDPSISQYNSQFAGAILKNITIRNIKISSKGSLQGLFASDGSFQNLHMENIAVETNSAHQIAIFGLLSGTLDLSSPTGEPIHVNLLPLRLAGGHNIYINSFSKNSSYQYGNISTGRSNAIIGDNRRKMLKRGTYYKNFDMDAFFAAMRRADPSTNIFTNIKESAKRAGTITK